MTRYCPCVTSSLRGWQLVSLALKVDVEEYEDDLRAFSSLVYIKKKSNAQKKNIQIKAAAQVLGMTSSVILQRLLDYYFFGRNDKEERDNREALLREFNISEKTMEDGNAMVDEIKETVATCAHGTQTAPTIVVSCD
jgi:hypothetical protein